MKEISIASTRRLMFGEGSSPVSNRYVTSPKETLPIRSSSRYPRTRILFGLIDVRFVVHAADPAEAVRWRLGAIETISKIPQARQNKFARVQFAIDGRGVD